MVNTAALWFSLRNYNVLESLRHEMGKLNNTVITAVVIDAIYMTWADIYICFYFNNTHLFTNYTKWIHLYHWKTNNPHIIIQKPAGLVCKNCYIILVSLHFQQFFIKSFATSALSIIYKLLSKTYFLCYKFIDKTCPCIINPQPYSCIIITVTINIELIWKIEVYIKLLQRLAKRMITILCYIQIWNPMNTSMAFLCHLFK